MKRCLQQGFRILRDEGHNDSTTTCSRELCSESSVSQDEVDASGAEGDGAVLVARLDLVHDRLRGA